MPTDHAALAHQAQKEGRLADAVSHFNDLIGEAPGRPESWLSFGAFWQSVVGDMGNARTCYMNALAIRGDDPIGNHRLGSVLMNTGALDEAEPYLLRAVALSVPDALVDLVSLYFRSGQLDRAESCADEYRGKHPGHLGSFMSAWVAAARGSFLEALTYATEAEARDIGFPIPLGLKVWLLWKLGRQQEYRASLQEMAYIQGTLPGQDAFKAAYGHWCNLRADIKRRIGAHPNAPVFFVNMFGGLGDQYLYASVFHALKEQWAPIPVVALMEEGAVWDRLFPDAVSAYVRLEKKTIHALCGCSRLLPDFPYTPHYPWSYHTQAISDFRETTMCFMGLPVSTVPAIPALAATARDRAREQFDSLSGVIGKSVLVANLSNSNPQMPDAWWDAVVADLTGAGFVVFQNMVNQWGGDAQARMNGAIPISLEPDHAIAFVELCGHFLGVRNGLCDLLASARARKKTIHIKTHRISNPKYPITVWLDARSGYGMRRCHEADDWDERSLARDAAYSRDIVADWLEGA